MTRDEALDKAAECLGKAETAIGDHWQKHLNIAQLYMTLAHEIRPLHD